MRNGIHDISLKLLGMFIDSTFRIGPGYSIPIPCIPFFFSPFPFPFPFPFFLSSFFPHVTLFTYIFVATIKWLFTLSFVLRPLSSLATIKLPRAIEGTTRSTISTDSLESRFKGKMKNSRRSRFDIRPWKYRNLKLDNRQARIKSREYAERKVIWFRREGNIYWTMKNKTDRSRLLDPQMIKIADTVSLDDDNNNISWPYKYSYRRFQNQRFSRTRELR